MRNARLHGVRRGRSARTTVPDRVAARPPDLVDRTFTATVPNQLWVVDLTYVATFAGFCYVAFTVDVFSRMIVGWRVARTMRFDDARVGRERQVRRRPNGGLMEHHRAWSGLAGEGAQTGLLIAAAGAPGTFEPSLVPRSLLDQGLITGLAGTLSYVLSTAMHDVIEAVASLVVAQHPATTAPMRHHRATVALDLVAVPVGLAVHELLVRRDDEAVLRGLLRQGAWRVAVTGFGGLVFALVRAGVRRLEPAVGARVRLSELPVAVPVGLVLGVALEARRRRRHRGDTSPRGGTARDLVAATAASLGVTTALSALAYGERLLANATGALLASRLPGGAWCGVRWGTW